MDETTVPGQMTIKLKQGKDIIGRGDLTSDNAGQVWFDYSGKPYPTKIDWQNATNLIFRPDRGKQRSFWPSSTEYLFQGGWVGPRLVLEKAHHR